MSTTAMSDGRRLHYGWVVVGVTLFTFLTTAGAMSTPSVLLKPLQKEFGSSTAAISVALSDRVAVFGIAAPFAAALVLRSGLRAIMATSVIIVSVGILTSAAVNAPWQLTLPLGLVDGGGTDMTALVLGATVANRWFITRLIHSMRRDGLTRGVVTLCTGGGQGIALAGGALQ